MLGHAFYIARKDLVLMARGRATWLWAFFMPVLFFYFIGTVTGGSSRPRTAVTRIGFYAPADAGFLADQFQRRLEQLGYKVERVDQQQLLAYARRIRIPEGFTGSVLAGRRAVVEFQRSGGGAAADYDEVRIRRAAYSVLADVLVAAKDGAPATAAALEKLAETPRTMELSVVPAGRRMVVPRGFQQSVPGAMVMFLLLVMFTTGGVSLYQERSHGILKRLGSTPMSRGAVVLGKWLSRSALGLVQTAFGMLAGTLLFKVDWGPSLAAVALVLLSYGALAAGAGMLLGNFGRTEGQIIGLGVVLSNVMAMVGGCWWPAEITPPWAQKLGLMIPTGWAMDALHRLISFGDSPAAVLPHVAAMAVSALAAGWILARKFRFQ